MDQWGVLSNVSNILDRDDDLTGFKRENLVNIYIHNYIVK